MLVALLGPIDLEAAGSVRPAAGTDLDTTRLVDLVRAGQQQAARGDLPKELSRELSMVAVPQSS